MVLIRRYREVYSNTIEMNQLGNNNIIDFPVDNNNSTLFKYKQQITGKKWNGGTKNVKIMVPLKYVSIVWGTLEMPLINCETSLQLKWSKIKFW